MKINELLFQLVAGGILGMFGQVIRVFVGLSKSQQSDTEFSLSRLLGSLAVGFTAGGVGILSISHWQPDPNISYQDFLLLMSIGYSGTDFLEGIYRAMISRVGGSNSTEINVQEIYQRIAASESRVQQTVTALQANNRAPSEVLHSATTPAITEVISLHYGPNADASVISGYVDSVLKDILRRSNNTSATVTSTKRTPESQANAMYQNLRNKGIAAQRRLYGPAGDLVIDVYEKALHAGKSEELIKQEMADRIRTVGPAKLSKHLGDFSVLAVVDIAPSSISHKDAFRAAVEVEKQSGRISKAITNLVDDPSFHLEIPNKLPKPAESLNTTILVTESV